MFSGGVLDCAIAAEHRKNTAALKLSMGQINSGFVRDDSLPKEQQVPRPRTGQTCTHLGKSRQLPSHPSENLSAAQISAIRDDLSWATRFPNRF